MKIIHYFDYKSPYAYLAQEAAYALAGDYGIDVEWQPYTLDIPAYLGAAALDAEGRDTMQTRNAHQWRRVKYSYMDCRREANRRGLVVRGPRKIFDSSIAHIGFLYAREHGAWRRYHDHVFEAFWKRELDIENPAVIAAELERAGVPAAGFTVWLAGDGRAVHDRLRRDADEAGVFGVPSWLVDGELFWGAERLERVRELVERAKT
jgi:2-hydroxychromene-2-carboxylate isomerase